jgi:L-asparaginase II
VTPGEPLAEVTRTPVVGAGDRVESLHCGHLVVIAGDGEVVGALGDPGVVGYVRSAVKPFQATACLELLARDPVPLTAAEIAVAWSSHRAEPCHLDAVGRLLARSGTDPEQLTCPPDVGDADPAGSPARIRHNCSGKHALFALAGRAIDCPRHLLLEPSGPLQRAVLGTLAEVVGPVDAVGVDGCGAPAVVVPLSSLARGFAALATEPRFAAVREAGFAHPGLVGGVGRLETALLAAGVVAKVGAEGVFAAGWIGDDGTARGMAVKAADGAVRAAAAATVEALVVLGVVAPDTWAPQRPLGGGRPQGVVRASPLLASRLGRS